MLLVIPCFRESERLPSFLPLLVQALQGLNCQIQVVDDGSPEEDKIVVRDLVARTHHDFPEQVYPLLELPKNVGKGGAVRAGWLAHPGESQIGFVDADGAVAAGEVARVVGIALAQPDHAIFASRVKILGRTVNRSGVRHYVGRVFATIVSLKLKMPVYDSQCGLKVIPGHAFFEHTERFQENGFAMDPEILRVLDQLGVPMVEIPVDWTNIPGSKVRMVRDSIAMYNALNRIVKRLPLRTS